MTDSYQDGKGKAKAKAKDERITRGQALVETLLISKCSTPAKCGKMILIRWRWSEGDRHDDYHLMFLTCMRWQGSVYLYFIV